LDEGASSWMCPLLFPAPFFETVASFLLSLSPPQSFFLLVGAVEVFFLVVATLFCLPVGVFFLVAASLFPVAISKNADCFTVCCILLLFCLTVQDAC